MGTTEHLDMGAAIGFFLPICWMTSDLAKKADVTHHLRCMIFRYSFRLKGLLLLPTNIWFCIQQLHFFWCIGIQRLWFNSAIKWIGLEFYRVDAEQTHDPWVNRVQWALPIQFICLISLFYLELFSFNNLSIKLFVLILPIDCLMVEIRYRFSFLLFKTL